MSHYKGSVTITQGSNTVSAYLFYDGATDHAADQPGWRGWFSDEDPSQALAPGEAAIELLDGRTGSIVIEQLEADAPFGGTFRGGGQEP